MNTSENMIYLRTNVKPILTQLFEEIGRKRPDDLVNFSIEWLRANKNNAHREEDDDMNE